MKESPDKIQFGYISVEKYQILMHVESDQTLSLIYYSGDRNNRIDYDKDTGLAIEKELSLKIEYQFHSHIDEFENVDNIQEYAKENGLNPHRLRLWRDIFRIYDEGENECVVTIQSIHFDSENIYRKIVSVEKGDKI